MAYDYGLVGGIGQGLQQGLLTYMKMKQLNRENQIQNLTAGVETDENGNLRLNQQEQQKREAQGLLNQDVINARQVDSPDSQAAFAAYKQSLLGAHPERADDINAMNPMSAHQVKDYASTFAKPDIAGGYGLQKQMSADEMKKMIADALNASHEKVASEKNETDLKKTDKTVAGGIKKAQIGAQTAGKRIGLMEERIHNQNLDKVNKDPIANQLITTTNNLQNAIDNFKKGGATPQEFQELQQAVRSNLGIKGTSTGNERSETFLNDLGLRGDEKLQFLSGDLKSVLNRHPQLANNILGIANIELGNKRNQYKAQVDKLTAGHKSFYSAHPELKADYESTVQGGQSQMGLLGQTAQQPQGLVGSDSKIADYAKQNGLDYQHAQEILLKRGYKPNGQ